MLLSPVKITSLFILLYGCFHYLELLLYHYIENLDVLFGEVHDPKKLRIHALVVFSFFFFFLLFLQFSFFPFHKVGESNEWVYFYDFVFEVKRRYIILCFFFPFQTSLNIIFLFSSLISSRSP